MISFLTLIKPPYANNCSQAIIFHYITIFLILIMLTSYTHKKRAGRGISIIFISTDMAISLLSPKTFVLLLSTSPQPSWTSLQKHLHSNNENFVIFANYKPFRTISQSPKNLSVLHSSFYYFTALQGLISIENHLV